MRACGPMRSERLRTSQYLDSSTTTKGSAMSLSRERLPEERALSLARLAARQLADDSRIDRAMRTRRNRKMGGWTSGALSIPSRTIYV